MKNHDDGGDKPYELVDDRPKPVVEERGWNWGRLIAVAIVAVLALCLIFFWLIPSAFRNNDDAGSNTTTVTVTATPTHSGPSTVKALPGDCPNGYPLDFDRNAPADGNLIPLKPGSTHAVDTNEEVIQAIKENPKLLAAWAKKLWPDQYPDSDNWEQFVEDNGNGKCLNDKGSRVLDMTVGLLTATATKVDENAEAHPGMTNSSMGSDGVESSAAPGITGDLSAIEYTLPDGTKVTVLKRCGNFAEHGASFPPPPPPPPPPSTPTTIATCPPGSPGCPMPCPPGSPECTPPCPPGSPECTPCPPEGCPCPPGECITTTTTPTCPPGGCITTTTTTPSTTTTTTLPPKIPTTNPSKPPGIVPIPLPAENTLQPTRPTLPPRQTRQTTPVPVDAPPVQQTTRTSVPPVEVPVITSGTQTTIVNVPDPVLPGTDAGEAPPVP